MKKIKLLFFGTCVILLNYACGPSGNGAANSIVGDSKDSNDLLQSTTVYKAGENSSRDVSSDSLHNFNTEGPEVPVNTGNSGTGTNINPASQSSDSTEKE